MGISFSTHSFIKVCHCSLVKQQTRGSTWD